MQRSCSPGAMTEARRCSPFRSTNKHFIYLVLCGAAYANADVVMMYAVVRYLVALGMMKPYAATVVGYSLHSIMHLLDPSTCMPNSLPRTSFDASVILLFVIRIPKTTLSDTSLCEMDMSSEEKISKPHLTRIYYNYGWRCSSSRTRSCPSTNRRSSNSRLCCSMLRKGLVLHPQGRHSLSRRMRSYH